MANPNIVNVSSILGKTDTFALTTTAANLVTATANTVFKINTILISNIDGSNSADVNIKYHPHGAAGAGTSISLAHTIAVAADSTLVALDRASAIYVQENQSLVAYASANSDLDLVCSFEIIE
jgi:hypothetical protein